MDFLRTLEQIVINAKKSLGRPYTSETINEKLTEIQNIEKSLKECLTKEGLEEEENILERFSLLKKEAVKLLENHSNKKTSTEKVRDTIMANLDISELSVITKLVPKFMGRPDELNNFTTNLELVALTIPTEKSTSFFNFIYKTKLELKVQNRIKQISVPKTIPELITNLKATYKPIKTANSILNEITRIAQKDGNVLGFANKLETLIAELNEVQIAEEGENSRTVIMNTNNNIAFNAFMNGLKDPQIITTIDASQVTTFSEAVKIAEKLSGRTSQKQVFFQKSVEKNVNNTYATQHRCKNCGGNHKNKCPAFGTKCYNCGKFNHFAKMCLSKPQLNNTRASNNNNRAFGHPFNNQRQWNNNNSRRNDHRNRNINPIQDQGNSQLPEATQMLSPQGTY